MNGMLRRSAACLAICLAAFLAACGSTVPLMVDGDAPSREPAPAAASAAHAVDSQLRPASAPQGAEYRISFGDILDVAVFRVPDLNRTVEVDGAGNINLPLIGGTAAAGKTVRELEAFIGKRLGEKYLQSPEVTVAIKDAVGLRITVDGAVKKPGVINGRGEMTLLRAIAEAQGFTDTADYSGVIVFRRTENGRTVARFDVNVIRSGQAPDPAIFGGDTIVVDDSLAKTSWKQFREALPVAGLFRLF